MRVRAVGLFLLASFAGCAGRAPPAPRPPPPSSTKPPAPAQKSPEPAPEVAPRPSGPPSLGVAWGTADPVSLVAASAERRWLAVCQARTDTNGDGHVAVEIGVQGELIGDRLEGYFLNEPGPGARIDAFGGSDPSGRYVALITGGRLVLVDTVTRGEAALGESTVDLRDDRSSFVHPRAVAFDQTGRRLLYLRKNGARDEIVVRELATGGESVIVPGEGELWRAEFDPSGDWVVLRMVSNDTNGNGRLDWPVPAAPDSWTRCTGPLPRFAAWEHPGDDPTPRVARVSGGPAIDAPGLIVPFGESLVERDLDGAIGLAKPSGQRTTIAKKSCAARVLYADPTHDAIVTTCDNKKGRADVRWIKNGTEKPLGLELFAPAGDHFGAIGSRLFPLYPGGDTVLVDAESGETTRLVPGDRVVLAANEHALVLRGHSLVLYTRGGPERTLSNDVDPLAHVFRTDSVVAMPPLVIDVGKGEISGHADGRTLAVSNDGSVLVAAGRTADATRMAVGPLIWERNP